MEVLALSAALTVLEVLAVSAGLTLREVLVLLFEPSLIRVLKLIDTAVTTSVGEEGVAFSRGVLFGVDVTPDSTNVLEFLSIMVSLLCSSCGRECMLLPTLVMLAAPSRIVEALNASRSSSSEAISTSTFLFTKVGPQNALESLSKTTRSLKKIMY